MKRILAATTVLTTFALHSQTQNTNSNSPMMVIEMKPGDTRLDIAGRAGEGELGRWLKLDTASLSTRYRHIDDFRESLRAACRRVTTPDRHSHQWFQSGGSRLPAQPL